MSEREEAEEIWVRGRSRSTTLSSSHRVSDREYVAPPRYKKLNLSNEVNSNDNNNNNNSNTHTNNTNNTNSNGGDQRTHTQGGTSSTSMANLQAAAQARLLNLDATRSNASGDASQHTEQNTPSQRSHHASAPVSATRPTLKHTSHTRVQSLRGASVSAPAHSFTEPGLNPLNNYVTPQSHRRESEEPKRYVRAGSVSRASMGITPIRSASKGNLTTDSPRSTRSRRSTDKEEEEDVKTGFRKYRPIIIAFAWVLALFVFFLVFFLNNFGAGG